jgi:large subunit ribosomal protein L2
MGKRIISQARGKGSHTYKVRRKGFKHKIHYPSKEGIAKIVNLITSPGHSAPVMKVIIDNEIAHLPAFDGAVIGEEFQILGDAEVKPGNVLKIKDIPIGTSVYNIERNPGDGGKLMRSAGSFATVFKKYDNKKISVMLPSKKEAILSEDCRLTIGRIAGDGRTLKPIMKASKNFYKMKARGKLWPRTSAVKMNAIDHPFGSGRGKRIKSKIAKSNAPPGRRVGHLRPRRTGKR